MRSMVSSKSSIRFCVRRKRNMVRLPGEAACRAPFTVLALRSPPCLAGFTPALRGTLAGQTRLAHPRGELLGLATYPGLPTLHFKWTRVKTIKKRNPQDFHSH